MRDEKELEAEIQAKGLNAPRLTPALIDKKIKSSWYINPPGTTMTLCVLTLVNGFYVTGESAAASPENFDPEIGKKIAYENARQTIWMLEGYLLRERLASGHVVHAYRDSGSGQFTTEADAAARPNETEYETLSYDQRDMVHYNRKGERVPDNEVVRHPQHGAIRMKADTVLGQVEGKIIGRDRSEEGDPEFGNGLKP